MSETIGTPIETALSVRPKTLAEEIEMLRARDAKNAVIREENEARRKKEEADFQARLAAKQAEAEARLAERTLARCRDAREIVNQAIEKPMCFQDRNRLVKSVSDWNPEMCDFRTPKPTHPECIDESPHRHCRECGCVLPVDVVILKLNTGLVDAPNDPCMDITPIVSQTPAGGWKYREDLAGDFPSEHSAFCHDCKRMAQFRDFIVMSGWGTKASCDKCKDGWVVTGDKNDLPSCGLRLCDCWIMGKIDSDFQGASLAQFSEPIRKAVGSWWNNPGYGLLLTGDAGTGKTHLACAIFKVFYLQTGWRDALFRRCSDVFMQIKRTFDGGNRADFFGGEPHGEAGILDQLCNTPLLVLDDVCTGSGSGFERRDLYDILDRRRNGKRLTIVTSNFGPDKIAVHFKEEGEAQRIASRIAGLKEITLSGQDRRLTPADRRNGPLCAVPQER
jgi:hypothetical protein